MVLQDFTLVKKVLIAQVHPIIIIIKLRASGTNVSISYLKICGYLIVFF